MSAIYFDSRDDATELIRALEAEGYATAMRREAFAGEDDADDHGWVLAVDPFDDRVVEMVDVYGGWMAGDDGAPVEPPELPEEPRR